MRVLLILSVAFSHELLSVTALYNKRNLFAYLLINPGLTSASAATSEQDCYNQCVASTGCSAVSYQTGTGACVRSMCAALHVVKNTGWNTLILNEMLIETLDYPEPTFEWMLTDRCGLNGTPPAAGSPAMTLSAGTGYAPSQTVYQGNAVWMNGNVAVYAMTERSSLMNVQYFSTGYTYSAWFYMESSSSSFAFFEFGYFTGSSLSFGSHFWLFHGGLFYNMMDTGVTGSNSMMVYNYVPPLNTWFHVTFLYNPIGTITLYLNSTFVETNTIGSFTGHAEWNVLYIGGRHNWPNEGNLPGRVYCSRLFLKQLSQQEIAAAAQSCYTGRIRIS